MIPKPKNLACNVEVQDGMHHCSLPKGILKIYGGGTQMCTLACLVDDQQHPNLCTNFFCLRSELSFTPTSDTGNMSETSIYHKRTLKSEDNTMLCTWNTAWAHFLGVEALDLH